ncbi:MAG TPA: ABC transporter permease [Chitinophagales bacterium]|nr:ABC transporter permease [Chitinophagales bacterium]
MKKIWYIIQREYTTRVRKKSFILLTILLPVLIGLMTIALVEIATNAQEKLTIAVKDESGLFEDKFRGMDVGEHLRFKYLTNNPQSIDSLKDIYQNIDCDGILYIPAIELEKPLGIAYYSANELGSITEDHIKKNLSEEIRNRALLQRNYNVDTIAMFDKEIAIEKIINDEKKKGSSEIAGLFGYACGILIYIFLIVYGAMVMRSVTEEKTNRIVEVLVTSVKPFQLMIGKIIGIGAVGLTQFLLWGILTFGINLLLPLFMGDKMLAMQTLQQSNQLANASESTQLLMNISNAFQDLSIGRMLFSFVFYFMFGYLFYASQFAAIGAAMTDDSDAQSFTFPVTIPIIISMVLMSVTLQQPFSGAAFWGSMLPFSSPIIMITRIPFQVPWWEQLLSMFILFISSLGMVYIAAKIYRVGILIQGKKITFKEIGKWIFY